MLGTIMGPLDASIANVAMPTIAHSFGRGVDVTEWILLSYMLVTASTLVLFGRLGDMFGQKRIYLGGFAIFGIGSLCCALAPSLALLISSRVLQALGAAMLISCTQAIIVDSFPATERGRAIGFNGAAVAFGLSTGPILGGAIVTYADWRWIFLINIPITIVALTLAAIVLHPARRQGEGFDPFGAAFSIAGLFSLSLALSRAHVWGWTSPRFIWLVVFSAVVFAAFLWVERRVKHPTLDLELFRNQTFALSLIAAFIYFTAQSGIVFIIPLAAQLTMHLSPLNAGLLLIPISLLNIVLAPAAGSLSDRVPARYVSTFGALLVTLGTFLLSRLPNDPVPWHIAGTLVVTGAGTAVFTQPNNSAIMGAAPPNRRGVAAAMLGTARTSGQLLGVAIAGAVYFSRAAQLGPLGKTFAPATTYFAGVTAMMLIVAVISSLRD